MQSLLLLVLASLSSFDRHVSRERDEQGASAVEYGLLITGIAGLIVLVIFIFGENVTQLFSDTCDSIQNSRGQGNC